MKRIKKFILDLNITQKGFLTVASSIVIHWFLDGFGVKPLKDIIFKFVNIAFSWSFDSEFGLKNTGYLEPDFIFILCILGLVIFRANNDKNSEFEDLEKR